jgi:hypothetical protein
LTIHTIPTVPKTTGHDSAGDLDIVCCV